MIRKKSYHDGEDDLEVLVIDVYYRGGLCNIEYRKDSKTHRKDGPAFLSYYDNGNIEKETYCIDDKYHRLDGPAIICYDENGDITSKSFYINGKEIDQSHFDIDFDDWPFSTEEQSLLQLVY